MTLHPKQTAISEVRAGVYLFRAGNPHGGLRGFLTQILGCYVTRCVPHKALKIAFG